MQRLTISALLALLAALPGVTNAGTIPVACSTLYAPAVIPGAHHALVTIHRMYIVPTAATRGIRIPAWSISPS